MARTREERPSKKCASAETYFRAAREMHEGKTESESRQARYGIVRKVAGMCKSNFKVSNMQNEVVQHDVIKFVVDSLLKEAVMSE